MPLTGAHGAARLEDRAPAGVHLGDRATPVIEVSHLHSADRPGPDAARAPLQAPPTAGQVAGLLDRLAGANQALAAELDAIAGSRRTLSQCTIDRLEHLVEQMRPAAQIRRTLAELDPVDLLAGAREWHRRRSGADGHPG